MTVEFERIQTTIDGDLQKRAGKTTGYDLLGLVGECASVLESIGTRDALDRLHKEHIDIVERMCVDVCATAHNSVEQIAMYAMMANTLMCTIHACIDDANLQADIFMHDMEGLE